ncbi:MAG TPA: phosphoribosylanthranilate isomerase [Flavobacteriaceae bacterium]|nr:phosphoribosylanthranilate isomerase [Flavobacteriaceae bacterium]
MQIKVCGLNSASNMAEIDGLRPDFVGMIFHAASPRFVGETIFPKTMAKKVGVFVDCPVHFMLQQAIKYEFSYFQLHGNEPLSTVKKLQEKGFQIIKMFRVSEKMDYNNLKKFEPYCDYFLFDTKGKNPGGNGLKFNWNLLEDYPLKTPFFLSGGIGPEDVELIKNFQNPALSGVDLNSRFEISPGLKNKEQLKRFMNEIRK